MSLQGLHKVKVSNKMGPIIQTSVRQLLKTLGIVPSSMHCDLNYCVADHEHHLKCSSCFKTINSTNQGVIHLAACMTPPQPGLNAKYGSGGVNLQKKYSFGHEIDLLNSISSQNHIYHKTVLHLKLFIC